MRGRAMKNCRPGGPRRVRWSVILAGVLSAAVIATIALAQIDDGGFSGLREHPSIGYNTCEAADPVSRLNAELRGGAIEFKFQGASGYLRSVLDALHVPVALLGTVDSMVEELQRRREEWGFSYVTIEGPWEEFGAVVSRLNGT